MDKPKIVNNSNVSFYRHVQDTEGRTVSLSAVLMGIREGKWKEKIDELRSMQDEKKQKEYKKTLQCFTGSGVYKKRATEGLVEHSGVLMIDTDMEENPLLLEKFDEIRKKLIADKYTFFLFTSCRGKGLAIGVRIDGEKHLESFQFLAQYYKERYGLVIDKGCKDVTRLRFISHDPTLYLSEGAEIVIVPPDFSKEPKCSHTPVSHAKGENHEIVKSIIASGKLLGDDSYNDWLKIGFALVQEFGEGGRNYFHELSKISPKYDPVDCDKKFDDCLRNNRGDVTFRTIMHLAGATKVDKAKSFNCTDLGNAQRLVSQHGDKIRFCFAWKKWLVWDGKTGSIDNNGQILRLAKATVHNIYREAYESNDPEMRGKLGKWGAKSQAKEKIMAMVSLAESESGIPISPNELDTNPYLLNCLNGTIDLKTGDLKPHDPKNFITKIIRVEYDPAAQCPQWLEFLETIFTWNYDLIQFIQRAIGYSLTGDVSEQCLFLLHGMGGNGKSTLLNITGALLGDYAQTATFDTFLAKKEERSVNNDIARMQGKRFVSAIEAEGERRLSEVLIKQLTGGDAVTARFLFAEFFEFSPQFKIWLACNHKPIIRGSDHAIWRRIRLIPFTVTIPEAKRDKHLTEKLRAELPGILAWAVQGCLEWQKVGLKTPDEVRNATIDYQGDMDTIGAFISECCILTPEVKAKASDIYSAYKEWCATGGEYALSQRSFGLRLTEKGLERVKSSGNYWKGIGITLEK